MHQLVGVYLCFLQTIVDLLLRLAKTVLVNSVDCLVWQAQFCSFCVSTSAIFFYQNWRCFDLLSPKRLLLLRCLLDFGANNRVVTTAAHNRSERRNILLKLTVEFLIFLTFICPTHYRSVALS